MRANWTRRAREAGGVEYVHTSGSRVYEYMPRGREWGDWRAQFPWQTKGETVAHRREDAMEHVERRIATRDYADEVVAIVRRLRAEKADWVETALRLRAEKTALLRTLRRLVNYCQTPRHKAKGTRRAPLLKDIDRARAVIAETAGRE